jgi:hypothetical protein
MHDKSTPHSEQTEGGTPNSGEKKRLMEEAQKDAAQERESEGGYQ